jgi:hypothetical protein
MQQTGDKFARFCDGWVGDKERAGVDLRQAWDFGNGLEVDEVRFGRG